MSNHVKSFSAALSVLTRHGHIKQRVIMAYEDCLKDIEEERLPIPMRQPFADLKHLMHRVAPLNGEGPIRASVRKMSIDDAEHCARLIADLYGAVMRFGDAGQATPPTVAQDPPQVPPFLVKSG